MKTLVVLIGLPLAGKSTLTKRLLNEGYSVVSNDSIVEAIGTGSNFQEKLESVSVGEVHHYLMQHLYHLIDNGENILIDQTNLTADTRSHWLDKVSGDYRKVAVFVEVTVDEALKRNQQRFTESGKLIPEDVIRDMHSRIEMPTADEGFDEIHVIS